MGHGIEGREHMHRTNELVNVSGRAGSEGAVIKTHSFVSRIHKKHRTYKFRVLHLPDSLIPLVPERRLEIGKVEDIQVGRKVLLLDEVEIVHITHLLKLVFIVKLDGSCVVMYHMEVHTPTCLSGLGEGLNAVNKRTTQPGTSILLLTP